MYVCICMYIYIYYIYMCVCIYLSLASSLCHNKSVPPVFWHILDLF